MPGSTTRSVRISKAGASTPACATSSPPTARRHQGCAGTRVYAYNWTGPYIGASPARLGRRGLELRVPATRRVDAGFRRLLWWAARPATTSSSARSCSASRATTAGRMPRAGSQCPGVLLHLRGRDRRLASLTGRVGYTLGPRLVLRQGRWAAGEVFSHGNAEPGPDVPLFAVTPVNGESKWLTWLDDWRRHGVRARRTGGPPRPSTCTTTSGKRGSLPALRRRAADIAEPTRAATPCASASTTTSGRGAATDRSSRGARTHRHVERVHAKMFPPPSGEGQGLGEMPFRLMFGVPHP